MKNAIEWLLAPVPLDRFFHDHWDRRPLHVRGSPDKFVEIFDPTDWHRRPLGNAKAAAIDARGVPAEIPIDPGQSQTLFIGGMTICGDVSSDARLAPFLREFRRAFRMPGGQAFANLYASNESGGFAIHTDRYHVFVLQMAGKKQWRFSRDPVIPHPTEGVRLDSDARPVYWTGRRQGEPVRSAGAAVPAPEPDALETVLLEEGACLYLPPGTWHVARAVGHSVAVSISPPRMPVVELVTRLLEDLLLEHPEWRRDVLAAAEDEAPAGELPRSVSSILDERLGELRALVATLDPRVLHRLWRVNLAAGQLDDEPLPAVIPDFRRSDLLVPSAAPFEFLVAPGADEEEAIFFHARGTEWALPGTARRFLTEVARQRQPFRAETALAWDPALSASDAGAILGELLAAGVLQRR